MNRMRKNAIIFTLLLAVALLAFTTLSSTPTNAEDALGSPTNPYLIANAADLQNFAEEVNSGNYAAYAVLTANIDLNGIDWEPIGTVKTIDTEDSFEIVGQPYNGVFDGDGYQIIGLSVNATYTDLGLFGIIDEDGVVRNLTVKGTINGTYYLGGIAGSNYGTIQNCASNVNITGNGFLGGITGNNNGGLIDNCANQGDLDARSVNRTNGDYTYFAGGIAGANGVYADDATSSVISNCYNTGLIESNGYMAGGITGYHKGYMANVYNAGTVSGYQEIGSVVGHQAGSIENAFYMSGTHQLAFGFNEKAAAANTATEREMKGSRIIPTLNSNGNVFKTDVANINQGFPVLIWQEGESIEGFYDIPGSAWYAPYISDLKERGLINGKSATIFDPDGKITRAEFAKILALSSGEDMGDYDHASQFTDVGDKWYRPYINWAYENGVVTGKGSGLFMPSDNITREEMAVMMARYANSISFNLPETSPLIVFADDGKIASWAKEAVQAMQQAGIITGKGNNNFDPKGNATRAEASKIVSVFLNLLP